MRHGLPVAQKLHTSAFHFFSVLLVLLWSSPTLFLYCYCRVVAQSYAVRLY